MKIMQHRTSVQFLKTKKNKELKGVQNDFLLTAQNIMVIWHFISKRKITYISVIEDFSTMSGHNFITKEAPFSILSMYSVLFYICKMFLGITVHQNPMMIL